MQLKHSYLSFRSLNQITWIVHNATEDVSLLFYALELIKTGNKWKKKNLYWGERLFSYVTLT
jgi:hypothetical protein